jgi:hypothetical protein
MTRYKEHDNCNLNKNEKSYKNVYIVLSQTRTYPARVIKLYTHEPYWM